MSDIGLARGSAPSTPGRTARRPRRFSRPSMRPVAGRLSSWHRPARRAMSPAGCRHPARRKRVPRRASGESNAVAFLRFAPAVPVTRRPPSRTGLVVDGRRRPSRERDRHRRVDGAPAPTKCPESPVPRRGSPSRKGRISQEPFGAVGVTQEHPLRQKTESFRWVAPGITRGTIPIWLLRPASAIGPAKGRRPPRPRRRGHSVISGRDSRLGIQSRSGAAQRGLQRSVPAWT